MSGYARIKYKDFWIIVHAKWELNWLKWAIKQPWFDKWIERKTWVEISKKELKEIPGVKI